MAGLSPPVAAATAPSQRGPRGSCLPLRGRCRPQAAEGENLAIARSLPLHEAFPLGEGVCGPDHRQMRGSLPEIARKRAVSAAPPSSVTFGDSSPTLGEAFTYSFTNRECLYMKDINKYRGIIPAFYACYAPDGSISTEGVKALTRHLIAKGVKGVYVGGSSGECIYQHPDERKAVLEAVMSEAKGKITVIAHVACNNTADSVELAAHAEKCGVDAIASIPPIYFHLPNYAIADYWNAMSAAAPNTEFIIYNIPQLAGTALTMPLLNEMLKNPNVIAVKNSSMPTQDIQMFKDAGIQARGADGFAVFNGPDEQFVSGRVMGADGGIGGTYAVMPELFLKMNELIEKGDIPAAREIQYKADRIIYKMCEAHGNLYAVMKEILRRMYGLELGGVRAPLPGLIPEDEPIVAEAQKMIEDAVAAL